MIHTLSIIFAIAVTLAMGACKNESSFEGGRASATQQPPVTNVQAATPILIQSPEPIVLPPPVVKPTPTVVQPDGISYVNQCDQCLTEAKRLSATMQTPFVAQLVNARSLGLYESNNYCDIHFYRNIPAFGRPGATPHAGSNGRIENVTSVVDHVVVYCPCNCGWTRY